MSVLGAQMSKDNVKYCCSNVIDYLHILIQLKEIIINCNFRILKWHINAISSCIDFVILL